ncbi:CDP-glycerol glycerophosphotransferase family protein [Proteus mirabilis]|uniref:CDP-glycerol glycerophosphotransferase family protein n=1 Tax=Proteus mirabilis TaxID=584 RepID=UPI001C44C802|nr:CDP-glycerol glycerophosphotransferase family protein [Proteus mirabilis]MCB6148653.1 CDP-glycerol glycerophosphotransferase family protein [Proteus mirabilis]MCT0102299.1 CDP-glycerol glycerophosphotransferase family protein [Proteus mirabilis]QXL75895.1 Teichoic acid poly(glycerol phosphate) polymerase [Proteus mirabilis]
MKIIKKVKKIINLIIKIINLIIFKKRNIILFYSDPDLSDNALALYQYIEKNHSKEWKCIWVIKNEKFTKKIITAENLSNINLIKINSFKEIFYSLISKIHINTHGSGYKKFKFNKFPIIISLWHGSPIKKIGADIQDITPCKQDIFISGSTYFEDFFSKSLQLDNECILLSCGYPRNDWLDTNIDKKLLNKKYIIWMPTFMVSKGSYLGGGGKFDDGKIKNGYISFLNIDELTILDKELINLDLDLYIKLHPYDILNDINFSNEKYKNIKIIKADDVGFSGSKLYKVLGNSIALISDYSSVIFDYIYTNKPIGIDLYSCSRYTRETYFELDLNEFHSFKIKNKNDLISFFNYALIAPPKKLKSKYIITNSHFGFSQNVWKNIIKKIEN